MNNRAQAGFAILLGLFIAMIVLLGVVISDSGKTETVSENITSVEYRTGILINNMDIHTNGTLAVDYIIGIADGEQTGYAKPVTGQTQYQIPIQSHQTPTEILLVNGGEINDGKHSGGTVVERVQLDFEDTGWSL